MSRTYKKDTLFSHKYNDYITYKRLKQNKLKMKSFYKEYEQSKIRQSEKDFLRKETLNEEGIEPKVKKNILYQLF